MAIFHCTTKPIARSAGRSSVAAAAYRSGSELVDQRTGLIHDYTRRAGVESAEILMPDGGTADRSELWNAAEAAEKRKDSRTAREWIVGLPAELGEAGRKELARDFARELAERYRVAVDVAIHRPDQEGDQRNHHAHILMTTREVSRGVDGIELGNKTALELGDKDRAKAGIEGRSAHDIEQLRERWADLTNRALEREGRAERIDHRSLAAQGIDREATTHLGPVATDMERRGKASDRGDNNRQVAANNVERERISAQIFDLAAERERRRPVEKTKTAAEIRQEIEQYKRRHGRPAFMDAADVAAQSSPVTTAYAKVRDLTQERNEAQARKYQAMVEIEEWSERHPMRAKMAAMGLNKPDYLVERENAVKAANTALEALPAKIDQADKAYLQIRREETANIEARYQPQREWVANAERLAAERERIERAERLEAAKRENDKPRDPERERSRGRDVPRGR